MIIASYSMIKKKIKEKYRRDHKNKIPLIIIEGLLVGLITGLVGAGGGF
jgi:uncharacterized membrane protein YfcA